VASSGARRGAQGELPQAEREYLPLTTEGLATHLSGQVHIGLYPLLVAGPRLRRPSGEFGAPDDGEDWSVRKDEGPLDLGKLSMVVWRWL
jgi:hypothetical protein